MGLGFAMVLFPVDTSFKFGANTTRPAFDLRLVPLGWVLGHLMKKPSRDIQVKAVLGLCCCCGGVAFLGVGPWAF